MELNLCGCGKHVRLSGVKVTVNRKRGVVHSIVHRDLHDSKVCIPGDWSCSMMKPYPKNPDEYESRKMMKLWNQHAETLPNPSREL